VLPPPPMLDDKSRNRDSRSLAVPRLDCFAGVVVSSETLVFFSAFSRASNALSSSFASIFMIILILVLVLVLVRCVLWSGRQRWRLAPLVLVAVARAKKRRKYTVSQPLYPEI
jgi:hypothetical protein